MQRKGYGSISMRLKEAVLQGVLFADYGSDFDSGQTVLGDPAGVRGKPGSGYGYGLGVRIDTSLGAVRFHLGIGSY